jgi:hypothetical protein
MAMKIRTLSKRPEHDAAPLVRARDGSRHGFERRGDGSPGLGIGDPTGHFGPSAFGQAPRSRKAPCLRSPDGDGGLHPRQDRVGIVAFARCDGPTADLPLDEGGQPIDRAIARAFPERHGQGGARGGREGVLDRLEARIRRFRRRRSGPRAHPHGGDSCQGFGEGLPLRDGEAKLVQRGFGLGRGHRCGSRASAASAAAAASSGARCFLGFGGEASGLFLLGAHLLFHRGDRFGGFCGIRRDVAGEDRTLLQRAHAFLSAPIAPAVSSIRAPRARISSVSGERSTDGASVVPSVATCSCKAARTSDCWARADSISAVCRSHRAGQKAGKAGEIPDSGRDDAADHQRNEAGTGFLHDPFRRRGGAWWFRSGGDRVFHGFRPRSRRSPRVCPSVRRARRCRRGAASAWSRRRSPRRLRARSSDVGEGSRRQRTSCHPWISCRILGRRGGVPGVSASDALPSTVPASGVVSSVGVISTASYRVIRRRVLDVLRCRRFRLCVWRIVSPRHRPFVCFQRPNCLLIVTHGPSQPSIPCHAAEIIARGKSVARWRPASPPRPGCSTTRSFCPFLGQCGLDRRAEREDVGPRGRVPRRLRPPRRTAPRSAAKTAAPERSRAAPRRTRRRVGSDLIVDHVGGSVRPAALSRSVTSPR